MPTIFDTMSAAERKRIANQVLDLPYEKQKEFVEELSTLIEKVEAADSALGRKKTAMANIQACRSGDLAQRNMISVLEGNLRRAGINLDDIVEAPEKINQIFASASRPLSNEMRMGLKAQLHRLKVIP
jgi:hypothetical protein